MTSQQKKLILIVVTLVALLATAGVIYATLSNSAKIDVQTTDAPASTELKEAADFTVENLNGGEVKLSDYKGKPVVLNFWASWCGPCKNEMPNFQKALEEYGSKVQFLMVNLTDGQRESKEDAKSFIDEQGYTFPVFYDTMSEAQKQYSIVSIPQTYFINAEGKVAAYCQGAISDAKLKSGIEEIAEV